MLGRRPTGAVARRPTEPPAEHWSDGFGIHAVRPFLLAGGLALVWFVQFQEAGVEADAPAWGLGIVLVVRLLTDFIGPWVALSMLRLVVVLGRVGLIRLRTHR
jgi:hypothetical protein